MSIVLTIMMIASLCPALTQVVNATETGSKSVSEEIAKLQIKAGDKVYKITEEEWEGLETAAETHTYSTNHRTGKEINQYTGVTLQAIMDHIGVDTTKISGTSTVIFRSKDGAELKKMTADDVFQTTRYFYPTFDETITNAKGERGVFVDDANKVEVPIMILTESNGNNDLGCLMVGMSGTYDEVEDPYSSREYVK